VIPGKGSPILPLVVGALCLSLATPPAVWAAFTPASALAAPSADGFPDEKALAVLQASLEDELVAGRLRALGISREQAAARLSSLTPEERELVASRLASIQAGGEVQVFISFSSSISPPLLVGVLFLWLMILAFSSVATGY
jgi:hypothetical protein